MLQRSMARPAIGQADARICSICDQIVTFCRGSAARNDVKFGIVQLVCGSSQANPVMRREGWIT